MTVQQSVIELGAGARPMQENGVLLKGDLVDLPGWGKVVIGAPVWPDSSEDRGPRAYVTKGEEYSSLGSGANGNYFLLRNTAQATTGEPPDEEKTSIFAQWHGMHPEILHSPERQGGPDPDSPHYYRDPGVSASGHACYGPYTTLEAGRWRAQWYFQLHLNCPPPRGWEGLRIATIDVVTNIGATVIRGPGGLTWREYCAQSTNSVWTGSLYYDFDLGGTTGNIECRLKTALCVCIARFLHIDRIG